MRINQEVEMKDSNCIFCKIANGEIPSRTLYEDENYRVILDLGPATRGHALVLPKEANVVCDEYFNHPGENTILL